MRGVMKMQHPGAMRPPHSRGVGQTLEPRNRGPAAFSEFFYVQFEGVFLGDL